MLWYLLYPIRGTTQPPRLSANHPLRRAFYRHGKTTAEHWLIAMLVTVAIAMAFTYPTILLAENPTAGLASYPHHVWTTAKPHDEYTEPADVEMRQVWIHGSYMRALEKDVLHGALDIQQSLIGSDSWTSIFPSLRTSALSWGYHSPLMYWNNSRQMIDNDVDILGTINRQASTTSSSLNVTLRPASVFAGKKFERRRLTAADALVITLINKVEGDVGNQWTDRMSTLTADACNGCTLFPHDGYVDRSKVYEFSFTPLSLQENILLTFAYSLMALYVLMSLRRLKAFHSRFGLVVTVITQMTCSILASFTICSMLKINLSMIPQNAYPFVVLVIGLENLFRIINAVLAYPATMATELRIANALGDVGPVSLATVAQNLIILSLLGRLVSPGVAAFCAFACIATLFDAFFLLTFFVAVLMVDIRRFELQDALARANQAKPKRKPSPIPNRTWFDALVHGRLPFSTRMAGTAVTTTFILSLNYHFFEQKEQATSLRHLLRLVKNGPPQLNEFDTFAPLPINATMTPEQWMRMQDFDTAKEVMKLARPGADSFVIRIFAPLIVVLAGADRTGVEDQEWTTALRSFAIHHFYPVATAVVFAVAFVAVLMNFLLYTEHEDEQHRGDEDEQDAVSVTTVALSHKLDIVKLHGTEKGHIITVGLDRSVVVSLYDRVHRSHQSHTLAGGALSRTHWPIHQVTLEENGDWAALHCANDRIMVYSVGAGSLLSDALLYPDDTETLLFEFIRLPKKGGSSLYFVVLTTGGQLRVLNIESGQANALVSLADTPLVGAKTIPGSNGKEPRLVGVTDEGQLVMSTWHDGAWTKRSQHDLPAQKIMGRLLGPVHIQHCSDLGSDILLVTAARRMMILDGQSFATLCVVDVNEDDPPILHVTLGTAVTCPRCGMLAFRSAMLIGEPASEDGCVATALWPRDGDDGVICATKSTSECTSFDDATQSSHRLSKPGAWSAVKSQAILGLRKPASPHEGQRKAGGASRLRRRQHTRSNVAADGGKDDDNENDDAWQGYRLSANGELESISVLPEANDSNTGLLNTDSTALYVTNAGPAVPLDDQSVAVAFGNTVKIVRSVRMGGCAAPARATGRSLVRDVANVGQERGLRKVR